jgi:hypothetical protein
MPPTVRHPSCPVCGADMRASSAQQDAADSMVVWRCIRCGGETTRDFPERGRTASSDEIRARFPDPSAR